MNKSWEEDQTDCVIEGRDLLEADNMTEAHAEPVPRPIRPPWKPEPGYLETLVRQHEENNERWEWFYLMSELHANARFLLTGSRYI